MFCVTVTPGVVVLSTALMPVLVAAPLLVRLTKSCTPGSAMVSSLAQRSTHFSLDIRPARRSVMTPPASTVAKFRRTATSVAAPGWWRKL